jgi:hypothetical protein
MRRLLAKVVLLVGIALVAPTAAQSPGQPASPTPAAQLPTSVESVREGLAREQVLKLEAPPIFRVEITERRPRDWDLPPPFHFTFEPQAGGSWHNQFLAMTTPDEARMYSPMYSNTDTAMVAATSLLFAGAMSLVKAGFDEWRQNRKEGKARAARAEVDAALEAWKKANAPQPEP